MFLSKDSNLQPIYPISSKIAKASKMGFFAQFLYKFFDRPQANTILKPFIGYNSQQLFALDTLVILSSYDSCN